MSASGKAIEGRSLGQIAWMRLRDKVALAGGVVVIFLILVAIFAPLPGAEPDHVPPGPDRPDLSRPTGRSAGSAWPPVRRRAGQRPRHLQPVVYGARISLLIAFLATALSVVIGTVLGIIAGYFGGWVDTVISRADGRLPGVPAAGLRDRAGRRHPDSAFGLSGDTLRIALLVFIIGFFNWPYIGRIIRGQTLSLREREFVDAARSLGARRPYILFRELLPNLVAPILVYSTLLIPTNILFEAALSFLGVGVARRTPTLGRHAVRRGDQLLHDRPDVHVLARAGDLRHRPGLQPVRRRAARRARPEGSR